MTTPAEDLSSSPSNGRDRAAPNVPVATAVSVLDARTRARNTAVGMSRESDFRSRPDDISSEKNLTGNQVTCTHTNKGKDDDDHKIASSTIQSVDDVDDADDPFAIEARFYRPHLHQFENALEEIRQGQKESHWMWYLVPTPPFLMDGVEVGSSMNRRYALRSDAEVIAYLRFTKPNVDLRKNYVILANAILRQLENGNSLTRMFPYGDHKKLLSSMNLFERVGTQLGDQELFLPCRKILDWWSIQRTRHHRKEKRSTFSTSIMRN